MKKGIILISGFVVVIFQGTNCFTQENLFTHHFATMSNYNPAFAGDTRFAQVQLVNRIQPSVAYSPVYNSSIAYNQKIPNHRSGIQVSFNQKLNVFRELKVGLSYSYTAILSRRSTIKTGLGISYNSVNTYADTYKYPDQYDDNGFTGMPTGEQALKEKASYPGFSAGIALCTSTLWVSAGADNVNRPVHDFAGEAVREPVTMTFIGGFNVPLDKAKRTKRIFSHDGGFKPYSSIGPVFGYFLEGAFQEARLGVNAFTNPVFWGAVYRINLFSSQENENKVHALNLLAGYRNDALSVAYSYDIMVNRTPTNYKGAHEISLVFYFYSIKEDYKKNPLVPLLNQLQY